MSNGLLGIFGDSYADSVLSPLNPPGEPWYYTLSDLLNIERKVYAKVGTSIWWSFNNFIKHYKNFSHIVFVYSQHNRWHYLQQQYETMHHITSTHKFVKKEHHDVAKILIDAYPITHSEEFDLYVYQKIFNDVNHICKSNDIKLINFMPFDNGTLIDYSNRHGLCIYNAVKLMHVEQKYLSSIEKMKFTQMLNRGDLRYCHMNWKNNKLIATRMHENLDNTQEMIDFIKDPEISSDPECIRELLKCMDKMTEFYSTT